MMSYLLIVMWQVTSEEEKRKLYLTYFHILNFNFKKNYLQFKKKNSKCHISHFFSSRDLSATFWNPSSCIERLSNGLDGNLKSGFWILFSCEGSSRFHYVRLSVLLSVCYTFLTGFERWWISKCGNVKCGT